MTFRTGGGSGGGGSIMSPQEIIRASWRRCQSEYQLRNDLKKPVERLDHAKVRELYQSVEEVFAESTTVVERIRTIAKDVGYVVLLSDRNGVVVESFADSSAGRQIAEEGLATGSIWQEDVVGTNGIGTALASRLPITVNGAAHFNQSFRSYTCSAAPIFAPNGNVVGTLDLSGRAVADLSEEYRFAEYFVREAASQISLTLFRRIHRDDCVIALANEPDPMPMSCRMLIATNEHGEILGGTPEAFNRLGVAELADLGGRTVKELWNLTLSDLKPLSLHNMRLDMSDGAPAYATAFLPKERRGKIPMRSLPRTVIPRPGKDSPLKRIAGEDAQTARLVELCRKIMDTELSILILGETGVGKDEIARAIHEESQRTLQPFVAVNCAAIPATLLASELFGYAPGSFTGASRTGRVGKIVAANRGTLFLDEIGDMPLDLQAHLLRVLEDRTVTPLGTTEGTSVDFKLLCATHHNLPQLVDQGRFRRDLYFRIKGLQITLPSLRERKDILRLAASIAREEIRDGEGELQLSEEVQDIFREYPWPGNVRELRNVIRFIVSVHPGTEIRLEHLPEEMQHWANLVDQPSTAAPPGAIPRPGMAVSTRLPPEGATLAELNEETEERVIIEALRTHRWNVTDTARALGISRATLHRKIRKYGIVSPNHQP